MTLRLTAVVLIVLTTLTFGVPTLAPGQAVRTDPNGNYDATGRLRARGGGERNNERLKVDLDLNKRKLGFDQTNGNSPLSGTLRLNKKAGSTDTKLNADVKGSLKNRNDTGKITKGKLKIKTNRSGGFELKLNTRGDITRGEARGGTFSIQLKGSSS